MDVSVTVTKEGKGKAASYQIKLGADVFEVNVRVPADDVHELKLVASSTWEEGSMQIGESAGAPVFWSCDDGMVAILIGEDDEMWDVALSVPVEVMEQIIGAVAQA
jgi:hypothetical protein